MTTINAVNLSICDISEAALASPRFVRGGPVWRCDGSYALVNHRPKVFKMETAELFASEEPHDPETLNVLVDAFEGAWSEIEKRYEGRPRLRDEARRRLADAVLKVVKDGARVPANIKESALLILAIEDSNLH